MFLRALVVAVLVATGCSRRPPSRSVDAGAPDLAVLSIRVPAALSVARAIDALSVALDPASLGRMQVTVDRGRVVGVETDTFVFAQGQPRPVARRHRIARGADFDAVASTWSTKPDGIPAPGTKYVVEMQVVLFQTDVPPVQDWDPHTGNYNALWTRTLRQAEE